MEGVYRQQEHVLSENRYVAVAIREPAHNQRHTGIFFRFCESDPHEFLHLAWQCDLRREVPRQTYLWVEPAIPQRRLIQVAAICDAIADANVPGRIPYSFGPPNDCFHDRTCDFLLGPTRTGLTCASFVLAVFHRAGLPLVQYGSWPPPTAEDTEWQQQVLANLLHLQVTDPCGITQAHIEHVRSEIGSSVRYQPEQVAAAALRRKRRPVSYRLVSRLGAMIVAYIRGQSVAPYMTWWERARRRWFRR